MSTTSASPSGAPGGPTVILRALADPTRRAIFERLSQGGERTVHALTAPSGVSQPAVSKHLAALQRAGLVRHRRAGRETYYAAQPAALAPLADWVRFYSAFWPARLDQLGDLLNRAEG